MTKRRDDSLEIKTVEHVHRKVVAMPPGGYKNTRIITKRITLPRVSILDGEEDPAPRDVRRR